MSTDHLQHGEEEQGQDVSIERSDLCRPLGQSGIGKAAMVAVGLTALGGVAGTPSEAKADFATFDISTVTEVAGDGSDFYLYYNELDSDGDGTIDYTYATVDSDGDGYGIWNMLDSTGLASSEIEFLGTDLEGYSNLGSAEITDRDLYVSGYREAYKVEGDADTWETQTALTSTDGVSHTNGFGRDSLRDTYWEANDYSPTHTVAIYENGESLPAFYSSSYNFQDPVACGDGMVYATRVGGGFKIVQYDPDEDDYEEISEITSGWGPTCTYDSDIGEVTLCYTVPSSRMLECITGQHTLSSTDADSDGYDSTVDCDDSDASIHPGATETPYDGIDQDCSGADLTDVDGDGYDSDAVAGGDDCDDTDPARNPGEIEACNGVDDDCDGTIDGSDSADATLFYRDADSDGYGNPSRTTLDCSVPSGYVDNYADCDDTDSAIHPGASETCNDLDDDCDDITDEDATDARTWYEDADLDNYGNPDSTTQSCDQPDGFVSDNTDCDDTDRDVNPSATEVTGDGIDNDCNPKTSDTTEPDPNDVDNDSDGWTENEGDCDDTNASVNPGAEEVFDNGVDDNCDGSQEDYQIISATGDCSTTTAAEAFYLTAPGDENCVIEFTLATGSEAYGYAPARISLDPGSTADVYFNPATDPRSYAVLLGVGSGYDYVSNDTSLKIDVGVAGDGSHFLGNEGTGHRGKITALDAGSYSWNTTTTEPTVVVERYDGPDSTLENFGQLVVIGRSTTEGDQITIDHTSEGDFVAINDQILEDTIPDDTGTETGLDDSAVPDTGTRPPEDGCNNNDEAGCATLSASPELGRGAFGTRILLGLTALGGLLKRRKR